MHVWVHGGHMHACTRHMQGGGAEGHWCIAHVPAAAVQEAYKAHQKQPLLLAWPKREPIHR